MTTTLIKNYSYRSYLIAHLYEHAKLIDLSQQLKDDDIFALVEARTSSNGLLAVQITGQNEVKTLLTNKTDFSETLIHQALSHLEAEGQHIAKIIDLKSVQAELTELDNLKWFTASSLTTVKLTEHNELDSPLISLKKDISKYQGIDIEFLPDNLNQKELVVLAWFSNIFVNILDNALTPISGWYMDDYSYFIDNSSAHLIFKITANKNLKKSLFIKSINNYLQYVVNNNQILGSINEQLTELVKKTNDSAIYELALNTNTIAGKDTTLRYLNANVIKSILNKMKYGIDGY